MPAAPPGKRYTIWDTEVGNFGVRVTDRTDPTTKQPRRTFIVMRRLQGKLIRHKVGTYPAVTLAAARDAAREANMDFERGIDPSAKRKAVALAEDRQRKVTFAAVAEDFSKRHLATLRSGAETKASIAREMMSRWGDRPIDTITTRDVVEMVESILDAGHPAAASKLLAHARKLFAWAVARKIYGLDKSPVAEISAKELLGKKVRRERVLSDHELRALWSLTAAPPFEYPIGPLVRLLLVTGQRLREVAEATWTEIDLDAAVWTIPASRSKTATAHEVPLSALAIDILSSLPQFKGKYLLTTTEGARPISGFSKFKQRIDTALGPEFEPWVFHDLRRTMRTRLSGLPIPHNVCELVIGHRQPELHQVYDRHRYYDEKRRAHDLWSARLLSIVSSNRNIVRLAVAG